MKIAFWSDHVCLRGTTVTLWNYSNGNREILGNESVVLYNKNDSRNHPSAIQKFKDADIEIVGLNSFDEIHEATKDCHGLHQERGHSARGLISNSCKNYIQQCSQWPCEPYGDVYAYTSEWLRKHHNAPHIPIVPPIVDLPDISGDFRKELNIPESAIVFGRTGGSDTWNLPWANDVIRNVLEQRPDIYFFFQNTPLSFHHDRVLIAKNTADVNYKLKFINTCDAMIHARHEGESFGMACAEFSLRNKPVITWDGSRERNHIEVLGDKGIYYSDRQGMANALSSFVKQPEKDWNCYRDYSPEKVMPIFEKVFINEEGGK